MSDCRFIDTCDDDNKSDDVDFLEKTSNDDIVDSLSEELEVHEYNQDSYMSCFFSDSKPDSVCICYKISM